jgi:hypothetical protein
LLRQAKSPRIEKRRVSQKCIGKARPPRPLLALAGVGILVSIGGQWLTGSHYAMSALVWLCIGSIDKFHRDKLY